VNENMGIVGAAVGMIPSGCSILTVEHDGRSTGLLVSWVQQVSFEPLSLSVCVKRGRPAQALIDAAGRFVLNVLSDDPSPMFKHFGKGFSLDEEAFDGVATEPSDYGPMLTECIAQLGCTVTQKIAVGDVKFPDGTLQTTAYRRLKVSAVFDPPSIAAGASATISIAVVGAAVGDAAVFNPRAGLPGLIVAQPRVTTDSVAVTLLNPTAGAINAGSNTADVVVFK